MVDLDDDVGVWVVQAGEVEDRRLEDQRQLNADVMLPGPAAFGHH
jgi:hypothetical protein